MSMTDAEKKAIIADATAAILRAKDEAYAIYTREMDRADNREDGIFNAAIADAAEAAYQRARDDAMAAYSDATASLAS